MLNIEGYIARRKKEDRLNEFDIDARNENMRVCVNYVFEYFNNYLDITEADEKTVLHNDKVNRYSQQLHDYEPEVRDWLVGIYNEYGNHMNRNIGNILKEDELFFLYNADSEFRSLSYDCYSKLIKKYPYLRDQTELMFIFIKDYHRVQSQSSIECGIPIIAESINEWIESTWTKYRVNLTEFVRAWVWRFDEDDKLWPSAHRKKSEDAWRKYEYDFRQKGNLFSLDYLYRKMPKKPFIKGRKQEFEILMMYYWLHGMVDDKEGYWQEYLDKVLPALKKD